MPQVNSVTKARMHLAWLEAKATWRPFSQLPWEWFDEPRFTPEEVQADRIAQRREDDARQERFGDPA